RFQGRETIVLLLDVWQHGIRHQTGVLFLDIIPRRPIGPALGQALARPVIVRVLRQAFGELVNLYRQCPVYGVDGLWFIGQRTVLLWVARVESRGPSYDLHATPSWVTISAHTSMELPESQPVLGSYHISSYVTLCTESRLRNTACKSIVPWWPGSDCCTLLAQGDDG